VGGNIKRKNTKDEGEIEAKRQNKRKRGKIKQERVAGGINVGISQEEKKYHV
jgi:hypothetical protein